MTELVTPHLRTVLKTYQDSAPNSLQGPGSLHHKLEINSTSSNSINLNSSSSSGGGGGGSSNNNGIINTNGTNSSNTTTNNSNSSSGHNNSSSNNNSSSSTNSNNASSIDEDESMYNGDEKHVQKIHLSPPIIVAQPPPLSQPILTTSDSGCGVLKETILEGKRIGCFLLGGEMRLCFPQILNNILNEFTVEQINRIFDELRIFCSQCTQEQLNEFKSAKILPEKVTGSGLITRTNAERLCSALLHRGERNVRITTNGKNASPPITFKVYHRCFGKCEGLLTPDLYSFKEPSCIECLECHGMFSAQKFVCHVHRQVENSVCHWGFDSNMWRAYLHVSPDEDNVDKYTKILDDLREREKQGYSIIMQQQREVAYLKRKAEEQTNLMTPMKLEPLDIPLKKSKIIEEPYKLDPYTYQQILFYQNQLSPFRPWTVHQMHQQQVLAATQQKQHQILGLPYPNGRPYLSQEPPVLQNPERVVRSSESERFERSFQPNVALVPKKSILSKEREREREREKERERERERDRDRDHRERERERERESSVIKCDVQIKQERPSTPSDKSSNSPELRNSPQSYMSSLPAGERSLSPPQTQPLPLLPIEKTSPISPEGQSGSNEITSSTSPVPVQSSQIHPKLLIVSSAGGDTIASPPPPPVRRTPIPTENIHHRSHHHPHSIPTQLLQHHQQLYLQQQQQHSHQTSMMPGLQKSPILKSSLSSLRNGDLTAVVAGVGGRVGDGAVSLTNGTTTIMINPEFELSTDTDDDSLTGEADSSLQNTAYDLAIELLKDTNARNDNRDKLLNIIKYLVQENGRLTQDIIRKDEYIKELLQKHQQLSNHVQATPSPPPSTSPSSSPHIKALPLCEQTSVVVAIPTHNSSNTTNHTNNSSSNNCNNNNINSNSNNNNTIVENHNNIDTTIATTIKIERRNSFLETNCTTTNNNINNSNTSSNNNNNHSSSPPPPPVTTRTASPPVVALKKTDIIMKPLKKSLRRSPEDSVVVLNNNHSSSNQSPSHPQQLQSPTSTEKIVSSNNNNNNSSNNNNNIVEKILI